MRPITFVTSNPNKAREASAILGLPLGHRALDLHELQSMELRLIVEHKAREAYRTLRRPIIVEDVGLYLDAWDGFPGPFIKWLQDTMTYARLARALPKTNRRAKWIVAYGLYDGTRFRYVEGVARGKMASRPAGLGRGWGFDPWFIPDGHETSYAALGPETKNRISARSRALKKLRRLLRP